MSESLTTESEKSGLPPGSLVHVGVLHEAETRITVVDYNGGTFEQRTISSIEEILEYREKNTVTWFNIEGLTDVDLIESIGRYFDIHPLVLEDILNTHQRPKFEESDDYLFLVFKGMYVAEDRLSVEYEQISVLLLNRMVFTFKEKRDDIFGSVINRLSTNRGRIRSLGADYLAYVILDTVVDRYFSLQDFMGEAVESIENELLENPTSETLASIQRIRRELIFIRKSVSPLRELLADVQRSDTAFFQTTTRLYFRDIYDHVLRLAEAIDTYRDIVTGLLDIYNSTISNRMNEIMKVLTVFASIFIPLTFITGIYGMNFEYMPELKWKWGYLMLWGFFIAIPIILLAYFKKKKWL